MTKSPVRRVAAGSCAGRNPEDRVEISLDVGTPVRSSSTSPKTTWTTASTKASSADYAIPRNSANSSSTHNANIPVLGDAEQIIILAAEQDGDQLRAHVARRGSIDDADLHGPLEDVLEGGREAFERRKQKYGF